MDTIKKKKWRNEINIAQMACTSVDTIRPKMGLCWVSRTFVSIGKFLVKAKWPKKIQNVLKDGEKMFVKNFDVYTQTVWETNRLSGIQFKCCWSLSMQTCASSTNYTISISNYEQRSMLFMHRMRHAVPLFCFPEGSSQVEWEQLPCLLIKDMFIRSALL